MNKESVPTRKTPAPVQNNDLLKKWLFLILGHWYLFVIFAILGLAGAYIKNRYTTPIYKVKSSVLIKQEKSIEMGKEVALMNGFSSVDNDLANQTALLKTPAQIMNTLCRLDFNICYYSKGRFGVYEFYPDMPFRVNIDSAHVQPLNVAFHLITNENGQVFIQAEGKNVSLYNFKLKRDTGTISNLNITIAYKPGQTYTTNNYSFSLTQTGTPLAQLANNNDYYFVFKSNKDLANEFSNIEIEKTTDGSSVVYLYHTGLCLNKSTAFLNQLMAYWIQSGLDRKNVIANNTVEFINKQLADLGDTLHSVSNKLQNFRTSNKVVSPDMQVQSSYVKLEALETAQVKLQLQRSYLDHLKTYLSKREDYNKLIAPSTVGLDADDFGADLKKLSEIRGELFQYMSRGKLNNPYLLKKQKEETVLMATIQEYIKNLGDNITFNLKTLEDQTQKYTHDQNLLPAKEQELFRLERSFKLADDLYTLLREKGLEAQIKRASNVADNEIVEQAHLVEQIEPQTDKTLLNGLIAGLAIPFLYLLLLDFLNNKIQNREDLERLTKVPVIGSIPESKEEIEFVTIDKPQSPTSESFRVLRTRITYLTKGESQQTIMLTSSMANEGKTYCAINLAGTMASSGKKTVILEMDLHKPDIEDYIKVASNQGISNYLSGETTLEEIIQTTDNPNLDCILAGPVSSNPAELITSDKMAELFKRLKEAYEYIIIDISPVGLVSDALLISPYCNVILYVVRHNFTIKQLFAYNIGPVEETGIFYLGILMNGIKPRRRGYGYGYGYAYGYGYGYEGKETKKHKKKTT